jgi:phosphopantothenoylcysteine decarboxylase/phosphopantothenate--cysteine ligase
VAISGGIAAYKIPDFVRTLIRAGYEVRCALTPSAGEFVSPLVLQTLTAAPVRSELFSPEEEGEIDHISLADWADLVVVAPATANTLAKLAQGIADNLVSTVLLATQSPILVVPAMNVNMWKNPATVENLELLRERGVHIFGPEKGYLACGWEGEGRMSEPEDIAREVDRLFAAKTLEGEKVLVTAGGTREPLDAVRVLANRSSGKMGFAIAAEAAHRGASVTLISGPVGLPTPVGVKRVDVETAQQMYDAVFSELPKTSIVIKAAAVADFRAANPDAQKIKKESLGEGEGIRLELVPNADILAEVCRIKGDRFVVGFAAESEDVVEAARRKILRKGCDLLVANDISRTDAGFEVDQNAIIFVTPAGEAEELPLLKKSEVASRIWDRVEQMRAEKKLEE